MLNNYEQVYSKPSEKSQVVSDLVLGTVFLKKSKHAIWLEIELPDGRTGFVKGNNIGPYMEVNNSIYPDKEKIVTRAKTMMGIPYMWGGSSTKALDCSGYTSTVFRSEGYQSTKRCQYAGSIGRGNHCRIVIMQMFYRVILSFSDQQKALHMLVFALEDPILFMPVVMFISTV